MPSWNFCGDYYVIMLSDYIHHFKKINKIQVELNIHYYFNTHLRISNVYESIIPKD